MKDYSNYMNRLTKATTNKNFYIIDDTLIQQYENGYSGEAINKLAKFENMYEAILQQQGEISKELEKLRIEGKTNSVKFKQLLANKLTNSNILMIFETYGL